MKVPTSSLKKEKKKIKVTTIDSCVVVQPRLCRESFTNINSSMPNVLRALCTSNLLVKAKMIKKLKLESDGSVGIIKEIAGSFLQNDISYNSESECSV